MPGNTTTRLVKRWQSGDDSIAPEIADRYAQRLCDLAESSLSRRLARHVNPEAIANSVLRTFLRRLRTRQITIDRSGATWNLLAVITRNKVRKQAEYFYAQQRDVSREVPLDSADCAAANACNPTVEDVAALMDEVEHLLEGLQPQDAEILRQQLAGESLVEITKKTGCSRWTVRRTLNRIGTLLQRRLH